MDEGERSLTVAALTTPYSSHPLRYSRLTYFSASAALVTRILSASHSIFLPTRYATLPRWFASVSQPEYSKSASAALPFLHASSHSTQWSLTRGSVGSGS